MQNNFVFSYDKIFREPRLEVKAYLNNVPIKGALSLLISWVNRSELIMGDRNVNSKLQMELLLHCLHRSNLESYNRVFSIREYLHAKNIKCIWLLPHTTLTLIEFILKEYHGEIFKGDFVDVDGLLNERKALSNGNLYNLLRAYFSIERQRGEKVLIGKDMSFNELIYRNFTERIGTYELERGDDPLIYFAEFFKSIDFFSFLENEYPIELSNFMLTRNIESWERYVLDVAGFFNTFMYDANNHQGRTRVLDGPSLSYLNSFVSHGCYKYDKPNFLNLKEYPLLKYPENGFFMISRTFLFEKMCKALFFEFQRIAGKDIKSNIGKKFFEEKLSNKYVSNIFNADKTINIPGIDKRFKNIQGEPDHYARIWNNVFVFESKDTLISDQAKTSMNNETVSKEIEEKLVWKIQKGKPKPSGTSQLANFIKNFNNIYRHFDPDVKLDRITFYPILIVQDRVLSTMGINQILNDYFEKELTPEIRTKFKIKPLVVMNIDCLILYSNFFAGRPKAFQSCLADYIKFFKQSTKHGDLFSFDIWMRRRYIANDKQRASAFLEHLKTTGNLKYSQFHRGDLAAFRE